MKSAKNIKDSDVFVWNEDYIEKVVDIPKKGCYNYIFTGILPVICSKGNKKYELFLHNQSWGCSCPGYTYRRNCSHLSYLPKEIKEMLKSDSKKVIQSSKNPLMDAAKSALMNQWNPRTEKMESVLDKNGNHISAYDHFWS